MKLPRSIKNSLITLKWKMIRFPSAFIYHWHVIRNNSLDKQINTLPVPLSPPVYETELINIKWHGSLQYPPKGRVCCDGDWDINEIHKRYSIFEEIEPGEKKWDIHETIRQIFINDQPYETTPQFKNMLYAVQHNIKPSIQNCVTEDDVHKYFKSLIGAYQSMKKHGYLTQQHLGLHPVTEMRVHVTREGQLCLGTGGNHRIRLAELLGIETVPVLIKAVHPQWVKQLCQRFRMPPHKALKIWLENEFTVTDKYSTGNEN